MQHYFSEKQHSRLGLKCLETSFYDQKFTFYTASGMFSKSRIDPGTRLLIERCIIRKNWNILDMGCGYGVVGIVLSKIFSAKAVLVDVNERALMLAKRNAKLNNCSVKVIKSNCYAALGNEFLRYFDSILINPPQKAGKQLCFEMMENSREFLKINGLLQIVARHRRGGETLANKMLELFGNLEIIAKRSGYRIYASRRE